MGTVTSTLLMQMLWNGSAAARKAKTDIKGVDDAARKLKGSKGILGGPGTQAAIIGGQNMLVGALAGYVTGGAAKQAFTAYADFDRRMTRIRQTADASVAEAEQAKNRIRQIAQEVALPVDEVMGGVEDLVASGRSLGETLAFLPAVAKTAQASGAAVGDIAKTADAIGTSMGIAGDQMQRAFDILVQQGKAGKFELKDMAQYLPSLAPAAAAVGLRGAEGLNQLAAVLQTVRTQTGSAGEAATSVQNIFSKMESQETAKKFKKFGIDLPKEMAKARKEGKNLLDVFIQLSERALKGDLSKIPQLFTDMEFARGMRALLSNKAALQGFIAEMAKAGGAVERDLKAPVNDARASIDRLSNAWSEAQAAFGKAAEAGGAVSLLNSLTEEGKKTAENLEQIGKLLKAIREFRLGDAAKEGRDFLDGRTPEEKARDRIKTQATAAAAEDRRQPVYDQRIKELEADLQAQKDAMELPTTSKGAKAILAERIQEVESALAELRGKVRGPGGEWDILPPAAPLPDRLPQEGRSRGRGSAPPSSKTFSPPAELPMPPAPNPLRALPEEVRASGEQAVAEAKQIADRIRAEFAAVQPVIKPRVEMPSIPSASTAGSYSDNGGRR